MNRRVVQMETEPGQIEEPEDEPTQDAEVVAGNVGAGVSVQEGV